MSGKLLTINRITALLLLIGLSFWVPPHAVGKNGHVPIAILLSDSEESYIKTVSTFIDEIRMPVKIFNLNGELDNAPDRMADIFAIEPALIFALGAKAAYTAKVWTAQRQEISVLFSMVLNWQRYRFLDGQDNITGIASEVAPGTQLLNMTIASPQVRRVGVIYSKAHSAEVLEHAKKAAAKLGLELVDRSISRPKEFRKAYKQIGGQIDGYWMLADPVVYTFDNVAWLKKRCTRDRIVCIGQSRNIAEVGMFMSVSPDVSNIGIQAASMAKNIILRQGSPKQIGIMPPLGTRLVLNARTARRIGLELNRIAIDMASEVIDP